MKVKCPACGAVASLDALIGHDGAREAVLTALQMPAPLAKLLIQYVGLFRPATRELSFDRLAKLLGELLPDVNAQRIERGGQVFDAPIHLIAQLGNRDPPKRLPAPSMTAEEKARNSERMAQVKAVIGKKVIGNRSKEDSYERDSRRV